jgi:hypothetical protein
MNNSGQIVFDTGIKNPPASYGLVIITGPQFRTVADSNTFKNLSYAAANLNDNGHVAFHTAGPSGGIWLNNGVTNTFLVSAGNQSFSLNSLDALLVNDAAGLTILSSSSFTTIVEYTDPVFGKPVRGFRPAVINDAGQVPFLVGYSDGTEALFRGDPHWEMYPIRRGLLSSGFDGTRLSGHV